MLKVGDMVVIDSDYISGKYYGIVVCIDFWNNNICWIKVKLDTKLGQTVQVFIDDVRNTVILCA